MIKFIRINEPKGTQHHHAEMVLSNPVKEEQRNQLISEFVMKMITSLLYSKKMKPLFVFNRWIYSIDGIFTQKGKPKATFILEHCGPLISYRERINFDEAIITLDSFIKLRKFRGQKKGKKDG